MIDDDDFDQPFGDIIPMITPMINGRREGSLTVEGTIVGFLICETASSVCRSTFTCQDCVTRMWFPIFVLDLPTWLHDCTDRRRRRTLSSTLPGECHVIPEFSCFPCSHVKRWQAKLIWYYMREEVPVYLHWLCSNSVLTYSPSVRESIPTVWWVRKWR